MKHRYSQRQALLRTILKDARIKAGLTQQELCKRLKRNRNFVSQIELGKVMLEAVELVEYAEALAVDPRRVIGKLMR